MPKGKIIFTLPPPARILLFILEVFLTLSLRVRGGNDVGEGAGGVVRVTRAGQLNAHPSTRYVTVRANRYAMVDGKEVAGYTGPRGGFPREEENDQRP
jgi:hypothetical protein